MTGPKIPQWAKERAVELVNTRTAGMMDYTASSVASHNPSLVAFAAYIAAHEEPPVDPLLIEAREIAGAQIGGSAEVNIRIGNHDRETLVQAVLTALRRGMELAKQEPNP